MFFSISIFTGSLSDQTGTYNITFYLAGVTMFLAGALCVPLRRVARWEGLQTTVIQTEVTGDEPEQSPMLNQKSQWRLNIEEDIPTFCHFSLCWAHFKSWFYRIFCCRILYMFINNVFWLKLWVYIVCIKYSIFCRYISMMHGIYGSSHR